MEKESTTELQLLADKVIKKYVRLYRKENPEKTDTELASWSSYGSGREKVQTYFSGDKVTYKEYRAIKWLGIEYNPYTDSADIAGLKLGDNEAVGFNIFKWLTELEVFLDGANSEDTRVPELSELMFYPKDIITKEVIQLVDKETEQKYDSEEVGGYKAKAQVLDQLLNRDSINLNKTRES